MKKALCLILAMVPVCAAPLVTLGTALAGQITVLQGKGVWPADKVPAELPPYPDGEVAGSGCTDECIIQVANTSEAALRAYLEGLKAAGWDVSSGGGGSEARKGAHTATFVILGAAGLHITVRTATMSAWPADSIPEAIQKPQGCKPMDAMLSDQGNNSWQYSFTCLGMSEQEANAYMDGLIKNGWVGDRSMATSTTRWRGKPYALSVELYEIAGGNVSFNSYYQQED